VERAQNMVVDWQVANNPDATKATIPNPPSAILGGEPSTSAVHTGSHWQPLLPDMYKCNIDAVFSSSLNRTSIGICIRESDGSFVLAKTMTHPCFLSVDVGEALRLHSALQWLSDMQFDNVDFETDSKLTYDTFLSDRNDTFEFGCIISSCLSLFNALFSNSRVKFVRWQANGVAHAHALAREATLLASHAVYYNIPTFIKTLIINEML